MKWLKVIITLLALLVFLCLYGFAVMHVASGGKKLGGAGKLLEKFVLLPRSISQPNDPLQVKWHANYLDKEEQLEIESSADWSLKGLHSYYNIPEDRWIVEELDIKTDSVLAQWQLPIDKTNTPDFRMASILLPILLPDSSLIVSVHASKNLMRLDKSSNVMWHYEDMATHHGLNLDADGNLWCLGYGDKYIHNSKSGSSSKYLDDVLLQVDIEDGSILFEKSLSEILIDNEMGDFIYRYSNTFPAGKDPLHTNDIQPVLTTTDYWNTGDVFLSLRNRSAIIHYRPTSDSIINVLQGPFTNQHDVDIISDSKIALFNNGMISLGSKDNKGGPEEKTDTMHVSGIVTYDFETQTYGKLLEEQFLAQNIFTATQGCYEILPSGNIYVESQNEGHLYLFSEEKLLMKRTLKRIENEAILKPHWIRVRE